MIDCFLTMYKYPEMLEVVVDAINRARKPREYRLWGIFEHGFQPELEPIFNRIDSIKTIAIKRDKKHGINWNTPTAFMNIGRGTGGDYVIQLQSDIVISTDFFEYIDWIMRYTEVGYTLAYAPTHSSPRDDAAYVIQCRKGWYGHWGSAVRTSVLRYIYPKYLTRDYRANHDRYAKRLFPGIRAGGSDFFINAFLYQEGIEGARPLSSRTTNIGIDGEHIRLVGGDKEAYTRMSHEQKLEVLRKIVDLGQYELNTNVKLRGTPRILGEYKWTSLHEVSIQPTQKHTGTDL